MSHLTFWHGLLLGSLIGINLCDHVYKHLNRDKGSKQLADLKQAHDNLKREIEQ